MLNQMFLILKKSNKNNESTRIQCFTNNSAVCFVNNAMYALLNSTVTVHIERKLPGNSCSGYEVFCPIHKE